jgi:hypothetical protein
MTHIFISYSRKDEAFARRLAGSLSNLGVEVWIDVEDIPPGMKWSSAIQTGLDRCDAMLVILSPGSSASTNVEDEWQYFLDHRKPVIPILWQPAKVHFQLSRLQYIDFHQRDFHTAFQQLTAFLASQRLLPAAPVQPPAPAIMPRPVDTPAYGTASTARPAVNHTRSPRSRGTILAAVAALIVVAGIALVLVLTSLNDGDSEQGAVATEDVEAEAPTPVELTRLYYTESISDIVSVRLPASWAVTEFYGDILISNDADVLQRVTDIDSPTPSGVPLYGENEIVLQINSTCCDETPEPGDDTYNAIEFVDTYITLSEGFTTTENIETFQINGHEGAYVTGTVNWDEGYNALMVVVIFDDRAAAYTLGVTGSTDVSQYEAVVKAITASVIITPAD